MRVAFLCRSLEPGKDGVGDYSRRLAGELTRRGNACTVVGVNDPYISKVEFAEQEIEGTPVSVLRLPGVMSKSLRAREARRWLQTFSPDWVSLQFVPFGFDARGLCLGLGNFLAAINSQKPWHFMFHELWLGLGEDSTLKERIWGALQRRAVMKAIGRLRPRVVHTQAGPYQTVLGREGVEADILPLFSNIPCEGGDGWKEMLEPLLAKIAGRRCSREDFYLAGVLGSVYSQWNVELAVETILPLALRFNKRLVLVFLGKNNLSQETFDQFKTRLQDRADIVVMGERPSAEISRILQSLDLGLATSPLQAIQKSGSATAMLEHGLPVLVVRDDWRLRGAEFLQPAMPRVFTPRQFARLETLPVRDAATEDDGVKRVAEQMLAALAPASGETSERLPERRPAVLETRLL